MSRAEILLQVKSAEEEAQRILDEAQERQKSIISSGRKEAVMRIHDAEERHQEEFDSSLSVERNRVAALREELLRKGREEAIAIEKMAEGRIRKAKIHLKSLFERTIDATARTDD